MGATEKGPGLVVVALGGNAMQSPRGDDSVTSDFERTAATAKVLADIVAGGTARLVVTHGNGPQVGNHLYRSELAHEVGGLPELPLDICVADTEGGMGYMLQQCLTNALHDNDTSAVVASIVTQVLVDRNDGAFQAPSKPVGEVIDESRARSLEAKGWTLRAETEGRGVRRVVPSPDPLEIVESGAISTLVEAGVVVIAAGGGGVPVVQDAEGHLRGIAAVVDKDLASSLLACDLRANALLILTDVAEVVLDRGKSDERPITEMTVEEARSYLAEGQFPPGSMGPKVEAVCRFAERTGRPGLITSIEKAGPALEGKAGTRVVP